MSKRIFDNDEVYKLGAISNAFEAERDELKQRAEAAEARAAELAEQLATAQAERDEAQHFLARIIEHCDKDGTLPQWTRINLEAARKAAGIQA